MSLRSRPNRSSTGSRAAGRSIFSASFWLTQKSRQSASKSGMGWTRIRAIGANGHPSGRTCAGQAGVEGPGPSCGAPAMRSLWWEIE